MNPSNATELDVPTIMRIGAARMTAGLDRLARLDLAAHNEIFGPLPRLSAEDLVAIASQVDLRGQGGAAFPFARKLKAVMDAARKTGQSTIVVVNATEGEPGSFKDKMLMIRSPYLILSGAALVAEAIGADEVIIGVAGNELANRSIEAAIAAEPGLRSMMRVVQQPDRFISGESGALVRGINGKKPVPPGRKTLASEKGVADLPTLLSNASTFAQIAVLALLGPDRFAAVGVPDEPGTVLLSVSGSAKHPAVVECPTGIPLGAVLDICQAPAGDGVLIGGYHGMWLDAETAYQVPVGREGLASAGGAFGSGIVLALGDGTCPLGEVSRIASYLAGESAGQCGPCKLGLPTIARALAAIVDGSGGIEALDVARRAAATINGRGACGHPDGTTRFVLSALEVFTEDLAAHVFHSSCGRPVRGMLPLPDGPEITERQAAHGGLGAVRGARALRPPRAGADPPGQDRLSRRLVDPGAAVAGEGSAARGADVPRPRAPPRHRPEEAQRRERLQDRPDPGRRPSRPHRPARRPQVHHRRLTQRRSIGAGGPPFYRF